MSEYSEMSDACIAQKVWFWLVLNGLEPESGPLVNISDGKLLYVKNGIWTAFDPCNSWADAGPIIVSNLIALNPVSLFVGGHRWFATKGEGVLGIKAADNNPLRAAMIVFLMMQEQG